MKHILGGTALAALLLHCAPAVHAQMNKCVNEKGKVSYQAAPCPGDSSIERMRLPNQSTGAAGDSTVARTRSNAREAAANRPPPGFTPIDEAAEKKAAAKGK